MKGKLGIGNPSFTLPCLQSKWLEASFCRAKSCCSFLAKMQAVFELPKWSAVSLCSQVADRRGGGFGEERNFAAFQGASIVGRYSHSTNLKLSDSTNFRRNFVLQSPDHFGMRGGDFFVLQGPPAVAIDKGVGKALFSLRNPYASKDVEQLDGL